MLSLLLAETENDANAAGGWGQWVFMIVVIGLLVVWLVFSTRSSKKKQKEADEIINSVKPGNKVKTIGLVCGIVVEVNDDENTFVLETGSEASGKSYIKFDKQAIYQTDAVVDKKKPEKANGESENADEVVQPDDTFATKSDKE